MTDFGDLKQLTNAVGQIMEVSASTSRKERIASLLGEPLEFLPRARQDLDAVLALTTGFESAALTPALQFHFAEHLPVYATSQSLRDATEPQGFTVTELPVLTQPNKVEQELIDTYNLRDSALVDLYAGIECFPNGYLDTTVDRTISLAQSLYNTVTNWPAALESVRSVFQNPEH